MRNLALDSSPFNNRLIFFLCVIISNIATAIENNSIDIICVLKMVSNITGYDTPAPIDPRDTYLVISKIKAKIPKPSTAGTGVKAIPIPNMDATPFPHLKPANTGNICPVKADAPSNI